jgi:hypothetical protein
VDWDRRPFTQWVSGLLVAIWRHSRCAGVCTLVCSCDWMHSGFVSCVSASCCPLLGVCKPAAAWRVRPVARELPPGPDWRCAAAAGVVSSLHTGVDWGRRQCTQCNCGLLATLEVCRCLHACLFMRLDAFRGKNPPSNVWVHAAVPCWGFASLLQPDASALVARKLPPGPDWRCAAAAGVVSSFYT